MENCRRYYLVNITSVWCSTTRRSVWIDVGRTRISQYGRDKCDEGSRAVLAVGDSDVGRERGIDKNEETAENNSREYSGNTGNDERNSGDDGKHAGNKRVRDELAGIHTQPSDGYCDKIIRFTDVTANARRNWLTSDERRSGRDNSRHRAVKWKCGHTVLVITRRATVLTTGAAPTRTHCRRVVVARQNNFLFARSAGGCPRDTCKIIYYWYLRIIYMETYVNVIIGGPRVKGHGRRSFITSDDRHSAGLIFFFAAN